MVKSFVFEKTLRFSRISLNAAGRALVMKANRLPELIAGSDQLLFPFAADS
jgi:hypothetical protein